MVEVRQLELKLRVPEESLRHQNETQECQLFGMCGGASADELFIADTNNKVVHLFDLRTGQLNERDLFRCPTRERLTDVAYSAHTDTLFVATCGDSHTVRSLSRTNSEWHQCNRLDLNGYTLILYVSLRALSDGSFVFGVPVLLSRAATGGSGRLACDADARPHPTAGRTQGIRRAARGRRDAAGRRSVETRTRSGTVPRRWRSRGGTREMRTRLPQGVTVLPRQFARV